MKSVYLVVTTNCVHGFWTNEKEAVEYFNGRADRVRIIKVTIGKTPSATVIMNRFDN